MAKCKVCGFKITPGVDKCPMCGSKITDGSSITGNPLEGASKTIFTVAKIDMDLFDVITIVLLGVFTLVGFINFIGTVARGYGLIYALINGLITLLHCIALWGLFVYYKSKESIFKFVTGIAIILFTAIGFIINVYSMFTSMGYTTFWDVISSVVTNLVPYAVPFILIILKNKDEKNNIKL